MPTPRAGLDEGHSGEWLRLMRCLHPGGRPGFRFLVAECNAPLARERVIEALKGHGIDAAVLRLTADAPADFSDLDRRLAALAAVHPVIHLVGWEEWERAGRGTLAAWNVRRERFAQACPVPVIAWLIPPDVTRLVHEAADLWAWRTAVLAFTTRPEVPAFVRERVDIQAAAQPRRRERLDEIEAYLAKSSAQADDAAARAMLHREAGDLAGGLGHVEEARRHLMEAERLFDMAGNRSASAHASRRIAELEFDSGDPAAALAILRRVAQTFALLRDDRSLAITRGHVADILTARGELDEALRIRKEEEMPVYERLGDVRERAVTLGQIADILAARGELDEALRILKEEELPVYEILGDVRSLLVGKTNVALLLARRGRKEDTTEILQLLRWSHQQAVRLGLPEAHRIEGILRQLGIPQDAVQGRAARR